ncbi:ABC transporter ATP-binding protein [Streptomyces sp. NPDC093099]|uniref:ABC transporter ATP-binding protein n=1 Tax=Streptomyces sp. NPDC093099 TaxID=3366028 RepID=UPI0038127B39
MGDTPPPAPVVGAAGHLVLDGLAKTYPGKHGAAVRGIDLAVERGSMLAVLGPSGCGKSTTLRMIAGLVPPTSGTVRVDGRDITDAPVHRRDMGVVFQSYALFPHLDVARNIAFGLEMRKIPKAELKRRVDDALGLVRLGHLAGRRIGQLSGGQQQRVALARALVVEPAVLLLDEPLSNLDARLRSAMRDEICRIQRETGVTTVFVTHDQQEALSMADRVAVMNHGRIEQVGTPEDIYERPARPFVAEFVGRANLLDGTAGDPDGERTSVELPGLGTVSAAGARVAKGRTATVMLRPHRIALTAAAPGTGGARGTVLSAGYAGETVAYRVRVGDTGPVLDVERPTGAQRSFGPGAEVELSWDPEAPRLVAAVGEGEPTGVAEPAGITGAAGAAGIARESRS